MIDTASLSRKLIKLKSRKVYLQVPEGLKTKVQSLASELEGSGFSVFVSVEPCFGACDLMESEARLLGCDVIVHVGHSDFGVKSMIPVIYEEYRSDFDPVPLIRAHLDDIKAFRRIGLVTTVQYLSGLAKASAFLKKQGKKIMIGAGSNARHPGQLLGCDYSGPKSIESSVDCYIFIGSGSFHPLGLAIEVEKPVLFLDFETSELIDLKQEKFNLQKVRVAKVAKAAESRNFGVLVSTKPGQSHPKIAEQAKQRLEKIGKKAWILVANQITPEKLLGLDIGALVNTACPRIADDSRQFKMPIISVSDLDLLEEQDNA